MTTSFVPGFRPSSQGLHFDNDFEQAPVVTVKFPLLGERGFGDASGGLCGGMVFAVRDLFDAGRAPPPDQRPPAPGTVLFEYLCSRLLTSFNLPAGVLKYYEWMTLPDEDHLVAGVFARTVREEWPTIRQEIDDGRPAPLGLVTVRSAEPAELGHCHQVLAYGYDLDEESGDLKVAVYDPNCHDQDDVMLNLNLQAESGIVYSGGMSVRGFFLTQYRAPESSPVFVPAET